MSNGSHILVDHTQLDSHAVEVRHIGEEIMGQLHTLQTKVQQLAESGWQGMAQESASAVAAKLGQAGKLVGDAIGEHGANVSKASQYYQQGEQEVRSMFPS